MVGSSVDLGELVKGVLRSCPGLTEDARRLVRSGQRALAEGDVLTIRELGQVAGLTPEQVAELLERLPGVGHFDPSGRVAGLLGLSVQPTPHRFRVGANNLFTWCAWDALFIPHVIGLEADVATNCPVTGRLVRMLVARDGVRQVTSGDVTMSFLVSCDPGAMRGVIGTCCEQIHFLSSTAAAVRWLSGQPRGIVLTLDEAWTLGRMFVDDVLSPGPAAVA